MSETARNRRNAAAHANDPQVNNASAEAVVEDVVDKVVETDVDDVEEADGFSWDELVDEDSQENTREDIIRKCLASRHFKLLTGLHVKNVKAFAKLKEGKKRTRITFVVKEKVPGTIVDTSTTDAFGDYGRILGKSNNVFTSAIAVGGAMKENAKTAIFADEVSAMTTVVGDNTEVEIVGKANVANILFTGSTIDVLCQHVPAGQPYINPFGQARADEDYDVFDEDRIFHHIVRVSLGEVGEDVYRSRLMS